MSCRSVLHLVALLAVALGAEGILAVVAGAAGLALLHAAHADVLNAGLEGEDLGVAVGAFVGFRGGTRG